MKGIYSKLDSNFNWKKLDKLVKNNLKKDKTGHDYKHTLRVLNNCLELARSSKKVDYDVLVASCLLHDISYKKGYVKNHHLVGAREAKKILTKMNFPKNKIKRAIVAIEDHVGNVSRAIRKNKDLQIESKILRDADNLDALGKIGLERQVSFCKSRGIPFFKSKEDKFNQSAYGGVKEIIKWADRMLTPKGKRIGKQRTKVMKLFLKKVEEKYL